MRRRLYWRIYFHFLGVLFVVGLAASLVFALGQRSAFQRELAQRVSRHVSTLLGEVVGDPAELSRRVRQLHTDLEVDLTVRDPDGRVLAVAGGTLRPLAPDEARAVAAGRLVAEPGRTWFLAAPIRAPGSARIVGVLEVSAPRPLRLAAVWRPGLAVAGVLLVVAVAAAPLARRIARPVERLTEGARRLGRGELHHRVPATRHRRDELAELTGAFNEMADRVERLVAGQKELLANVSHELRSPLARIRVALALLPEDEATGGRVRDLEAELAELDRLIEDVLTAARLDATGLPPRRAPVDVGGLLAEVAERAARDPATADRAVRVLPGQPLTLTADAALLKRALWNLVENAAKYGAPPITLAAEPAGGAVLLSVSDGGEGIPPADRERVLAPFQRLDRARTPSAPGEPPRGFGLGLTLARRIAEVHGGSIAIGPAAIAGGREQGCRVTLTLPDPAPAAPGSAAPAADEPR